MRVIAAVIVSKIAKRQLRKTQRKRRLPMPLQRLCNRQALGHIHVPVRIPQ